MENAIEVKRKKLNIRYVVAIIFMLLFITSDLIFDFAFSFKESDMIAFGFTLLSAVIVFLGTWRVKKDEKTKAYFRATSFIKSNFDNAQVVFSVLDIICGLISLFSSFFFLSYTFKIVKIFYIPTKVVVVVNKEKSILKPIVKFSYLWTAMRLLERKGGKFMNFIKRNKWTLLIGTIISGVVTFGVYKVLPLYVTLPLWGLILVCVGAFALIFAGCFFLGNDTMKSAIFRLAEKVLPKEQSDKLVDAAEKAIKEVEDAKAKLEEQKKVDAEAQRLYKIEKAEAEAAAKAKAKEDAKAQKKAEVAEVAKEEKVQEDAVRAQFEAKVQARLAELRQQEHKE